MLLMTQTQAPRKLNHFVTHLFTTHLRECFLVEKKLIGFVSESLNEGSLLQPPAPSYLQ